MYSVVIPLYNKQDSIANAIQSVLEQEIQDFELVVVNDGSTDDSAARVRDFDDERIHLYEQENGGASAARNRGIGLAKYSHIAFLDADDQWLPEYLSLITGLIKRFPDAGAYTTNYLIENPGKTVKAAQMKFVPQDKKGGLLESYYRSTAYGNTPITSSNVCISKAVFEKVGLFPEGIRLYEDLDMWVRIAAQFRIAYIHSPASIYRRNAENRACNSIVPNRADFHFSETLEKGIQSGTIYGDEVKFAIELMNSYALLNAFKAVIAGDSEEGRYILSGVRPQSIGKFIRKIFISVLSFLPRFFVTRFWQFGREIKS